jgi:hypothetical protein
MKRFGGETFDPKQRGKGTRWARWNKSPQRWSKPLKQLRLATFDAPFGDGSPSYLAPTHAREGAYS